MNDPANPCPSRRRGQALVEGKELRRIATRSDVQGIGKIQAGVKPCKGEPDLAAVLEVHLGGPSEGFESAPNLCSRKIVRAPQYPFGFEQHGLGHEDSAAFHQLAGATELLRIVRREKSDEDVSIDRAHAAP